MLIESVQNSRIRNLQRLLTDNRFRKKSGTFAVEGKQENERAVKFGFKPVEYFISEEIFDGDFPKGKITLISDKVYGKIAYRGSTEGIIGVYKTRSTPLEDFKPTANAAAIIIESVEKPGNLGAILRSCEAFGIEALIVADSKVDFYNPNVIRSSVGCLFGMQLIQCENADLARFLKDNDFKVFTTFMAEEARSLPHVNLKQKCALLFGTEHSGLSVFWKNAGENVTVPMAGSIDSLNLSNAVAVACYEILRQRL